MATISLVLAVIFVVTNLCSVHGQRGEPMRFETPKMNEEEQHSHHIPNSMQCDACTAVAYQLTTHLQKAESKRLSAKRDGLTESEYLDLLENVCETAWENYGVKTVNGVNRISGDGLEAKDIPGMMQGGGKWPGRLREKCFGITGDVGEDEIYNIFRERGDLHEYICTEFTDDCVTERHNEL